jgi:aconitate hydratase
MVQLEADEGATYDKEIEIDLATIEPLIALPEPGDV